jgi:hypothetical protein
MIDVDLLQDVCIENIDMKDYPDFCDVMLVGATLCGRELTDDELEEVQENNPEWVHEQAHESLH